MSGLGRLERNWERRMSEAMWRKENGVSAQPTPSMATYSDAMNKFAKAATAFMDQVHLLNEARDADSLHGTSE